MRKNIQVSTPFIHSFVKQVTEWSKLQSAVADYIQKGASLLKSLVCRAVDIPNTENILASIIREYTRE